MKAFILCLLCLLSWTIPAFAHESMPASLTLNEVQENVFDVDWRIPATQGNAPALMPQFPTHCSVERGPVERLAPAARLVYWRLHCKQDLANGARIGIDGLPATMVNVQVQLTMADGRRWSQLASPRSPHVVLGAERVKLAAYFRLGVEHILTGIDHLLFLLCLVVLVPARWRLLQTITAFTLAHCATLALATLGLIHIPSAPVEACIALSIVLLAREIMQPATAGTMARRQPWLLAFGFGLLHGLGFAGGLADVGLPSGEVIQALLLFNFGVEAGQLAFVLAVLLLLLGLRMRPLAMRRAEHACAYGVGTVAMFWLLQRLTPILI